MSELTFKQKIEHLIYGLELMLDENYKTTEKPYYFQLESTPQDYNNVVMVDTKNEAIKIANEIACNKAIVVDKRYNKNSKIYLRVIVGTP